MLLPGMATSSRVTTVPQATRFTGSRPSGASGLSDWDVTRLRRERGRSRGCVLMNRGTRSPTERPCR